MGGQAHAARKSNSSNNGGGQQQKGGATRPVDLKIQGLDVIRDLVVLQRFANHCGVVLRDRPAGVRQAGVGRRRRGPAAVLSSPPLTRLVVLRCEDEDAVLLVVGLRVDVAAERAGDYTRWGHGRRLGRGRGEVGARVHTPRRFPCSSSCGRTVSTRCCCTHQSHTGPCGSPEPSTCPPCSVTRCARGGGASVGGAALRALRPHTAARHAFARPNSLAAGVVLEPASGKDGSGDGVRRRRQAVLEHIAALAQVRRRHLQVEGRSRQPVS